MPLPAMVSTLTGKFLGGVGLGALLAGLFNKTDWIIGGLVILLISVLIQLPGAYFALKKK